jgi:hypothetical protein
VSTTAFITHCWKKLRQTLEGLVRVWVLLLCSGLITQALAMADIEQLRVERQEADLLLQVQLKLDLGPVVEEALTKGVAVHFVAEAEVLRERWYWTARKIGQVSRYYRLAYQPLTRQWRLQVASEPIHASGASSSLAQSYESLSAALDVIRRQSGWRVADVADLDPDARQSLTYRFRLDMAQLPRPFLIGAGNQSDWNLNLSRQLRITPEVLH